MFFKSIKKIGEKEMIKPFNTRSTTIKEEHKNDTFITPRQNIIDLGNYIKNNNLIKNRYSSSGVLFLDFSCGTGENKDNIYNNIKDIIFDEKPHCYVGSDIDELELTNNIKNNIESLKNIIYDNTGSKLSNFLNICIIMNPPYKIKNIFLETVIELRKEVFKKRENKSSESFEDSLKNLIFSYFILLPTASFSSIYRKKILQETQKPFLLANSKRIQFVDNGSSNLDTAWFCRSDVVGFFNNVTPLIESNDFVD